LLLDVSENSGVGDTVMWLTVIFCGRTWTITLDEKHLVKLVDHETVLRVWLML
jgi:hypothetical protein